MGAMDEFLKYARLAEASDPGGINELIRKTQGLALHDLHPAYSCAQELAAHREAAGITDFSGMADEFRSIREAIWSPHLHLLPTESASSYARALELSNQGILSPNNLAAMEAVRCAGISGSALEDLLPSYPDLLSIAAHIETPWMLRLSPEQSLAALGSFSALSAALKLGPTLSSSTLQVRALLGDWSESQAMLTAYELAAVNASPDHDTQLRLDLYARLGFDSRLASIPDAAFSEVLYKTDLLHAGLFAPGFSDPEPEEDEDADEFSLRSRLVAAYSIFSRVEAETRRFIVVTLSAGHGPKWQKQRVGGRLLQEWRNKRDAAVKNGEIERPLIEYAGFSDCSEVMARNDNWPLFEPRFGNRESMQESFRRLNVLRLPIAHTRPITRDDFILLVAEATRVLRALGIEFDPDEHL